MSVVIAYRDQPEVHYAFDDVVVTPTAGVVHGKTEIVLIAG